MPTLSKKLQRGEVESRRNDDMAMVFEKHQRLVTALSTKHKERQNDMIKIPNKYPSQSPCHET